MVVRASMDEIVLGIRTGSKAGFMDAWPHRALCSEKPHARLNALLSPSSIS